MLDAKVHEQLLVHTDKELEVLENKPDFSPVFFKRLEGDFYRDRHMLIEKHTRFIAVPMHSHDFIELVYVYSGKMRQVVNGKSVELKAGELLLLNQYAQHEIEVTGEEDIIINFIIEADYIARLISLFDDENLITKFILSSINGKNKSGEHVHFKVSHDKDIQKSACNIINEIYSDKVLKQMRVHFLVGLLITGLLSNVDNSDYYISSNYIDSLALTVLKYIDENYQDASLKVIADKINQPNYKVSRLLKSYTGKTFSELVIEKRIERAIYLLTYTDHSIIDVINMTGYENASHFYRVFKDKYNVSVKEYRDSIKVKDDVSFDC